MTGSVSYFENDRIELDDPELIYFKYLLTHYKSDPPFEIDVSEKSMHLKQGYVGIISSPFREIVIKPRDKEFGFSEILKMWLVVNTGKIYDGISQVNQYSGLKDNLFLNIVNQFIEEAFILCKSGLKTEYREEIDRTSFLRGKLIIEKYELQPLKDKFICNIEKLDYNTDRNGIIKYCVKRLINSVRDKHIKRNLLVLLSYFQNVKEKSFYSQSDFEKINRTTNRLNKHYESVISLCELILTKMVIGGIGGKIKWYSFLINYDSLFENFVRMVLQIKLGDVFGKLPKSSKIFSRYIPERSAREITKYYDPDIVYRYDVKHNTSQMILDVKNKLSNFLARTPSGWFDNPDLFQVIAYSRMQNTNKAVLVYPSTRRIEPIRLDIINERLSEYAIYAVFVDLMENKLSKIMNLLTKDILSLI
ncbi:MAG: McrC family protein [Candidatus Thermoplasmatota archaeon]|nr:McrC family protein [Candidatus Thermoplasmatota archaeon]